MSECVVRMEMPKACWSCGLRFVCKAANDFLTRKEAGCLVLKVGMEGCLIVCQLPEEHGRLIDADVILQYLREKTAMFDAVDGKMELVSLTIRNDLQGFIKTILETPTVVPAERSET